MTVKAANRVHVLVLGGETLGVAVADRLLRDNVDVTFLDSDPEAIESAAALGVTAEAVDVTSGQALETALPDEDAIDLAIVAAEPDATTLLLGQLAKTKLDVPRVLVLLNEPENRGVFETAGMIPLCRTTALADAVVATISRLLGGGSELPPGQSASSSLANSPRWRESV